MYKSEKDEAYYGRLSEAEDVMIKRINNGAEYEIPDVVSSLASKYNVDYDDLMALYDQYE